MAQAERLTQREAVAWARRHTNKEQHTHHVYCLDPEDEVQVFRRLLHVLPRFLVQPDGLTPPDGAKLVATISFSEKRESGSTRPWGGS